MKENALAGQIYIAPFFTGVFGAAAALGPEWSPFWGAVWLGIFSICLAWSLVAKSRKRHTDAKWRVFFLILQVDAGVWLLAVPLWRELGQPPTLGVVMATILIGGGLLSYHYRRIVMRELLDPQTAWGRIGIIGGGTAGTLAYFLGKLLSSTMLALLLALTGLLLVIIFQGFWVYVEEPGWKPPKAVPQNKNNRV